MFMPTLMNESFDLMKNEAIAAAEAEGCNFMPSAAKPYLKLSSALKLSPPATIYVGDGIGPSIEAVTVLDG